MVTVNTTMARPEVTTSSAHGRTKIRKHGERYVNRTLALLDRLYAQAKRKDASFDDIKAAYDAYIQVLPFIKPKLQAIAPAMLDAEGDLTPQIVANIFDKVQEAEEQKKLTGYKEEDAVQEQDNEVPATEGTESEAPE